jgi:hypothetical protein
MVIMKKGGERARVGIPEVLAEVGKLGRQRDGFPTVPLVIVPDNDLNAGKELSRCRLEHAETQGLKPDVRVVEILDWRLDQQDLHNIGETKGF